MDLWFSKIGEDKEAASSAEAKISNTVITMPLATEESNNSGPKRHPGDPIDEEIERHNLTHCPFRSWCKFCFEVQGVEDPHPNKERRS